MLWTFSHMWGRRESQEPDASQRSTTTCLRGRYSPAWPDGTQHSLNVYAHTREECEKKLKALIVEMKAEIAEAPRPMDLGKGNGRPPEEKKGKRGKKK